MNGWRLQLRTNVDFDVDGSVIDGSAFAECSERDVCKTRLHTSTGLIELGSIFRVNRLHDTSRVEMTGDLRRFRYLAARQRQGELWIEGDVGDFLGGAYGANRVGISGGRVVIHGNAGNYVGHRMRRGTISIQGSCGNFMGSHLVAGTIMLSGTSGAHIGYAMRRGTLILAGTPDLSTTRFSAPIALQTPFLSLLAQLRPWAQFESMFAKEMYVTRGDEAVGGQGEIWFPE